MKAVALLPLALVAACASTGPRSGASTRPGETTVTTLQTGAGEYHVNRVTEHVVDEFVAPASLDRVWPALSTAYAKLGISGAGAVTGQEHAFGVAEWRTNGRLLGAPASKYLDCGQLAMGEPAADASALRIRVITTLQAQGEGSTRVITTVEGKASARTGNVDLGCISTGELEKAIEHALMTSL
jgi:hypothetical protein